MSQDLIQVLTAIKATLEEANQSGVITDTIWHGPGETLWDFIDNRIDRHRSSVESVELPEPLFYYRPTCGGEMYEGPHHAKSVGGRMLREEKPGEWVGLIDASTVRSLIAAAVERERELCAKVCDGVYYQHIGPLHGEVRYGIAKCAAAIRARGEK